MPKDLRAFLSLARDRHVDVPMMRHVLDSNTKHIERAYDLVARHGRGRVALFGLAFKGGTDDLRESPMVELAEKLIGKGFEVTIHDEHVHTAKLTGSNLEYIDKEIPHLERLMRETPAEALAGARIVIVAKADADVIQAIAGTARDVAIVDLQGNAELEALGRESYAGICWP